MTNILIANFLEAFANVTESFILTNDSFPVLFNAYIKRGKVRRKPGSTLLGRLQRDLVSQSLGVTDGAGNFTGNIISILSLESTSQIVPGSISVTVGAQVFTEPATPDGSLSNGAGGTGTINYSSSVITLNTNPNLAATAITITFSYYPDLPVMGIEEFNQVGAFPFNVYLDTVYSYQFDESTQLFYDTSFYAVSHHPLTWTGADYQQFASTSYHRALFVTNGKAGFQFKNIESIVTTLGPNIATITITNHGLETGDYVYVNEVAGIPEINGLTAEVTFIDANNFSIPIPAAVPAAGPFLNTGIVQYITQTAVSNSDGLKYYTGDPIADSSKGWVNFAPPLSSYDETTNPNPQYLIGADYLFPFKDRLLYFGTTIATSVAPGGVYNENQVVYSQNGTPYYFVTDSALPNPVIPTNEEAQVEAWYQNVPARGGFINAPVQQQIISVVSQADILLLGLESSNFRFVFTGDDSFPFIFQSISADFGSGHTFAALSLENDVLFIGNYGFARATSTTINRIDLKIPDEVFQIGYNTNDSKRVCAIRDYRNQWVYFTAPLKQNSPPCKFNNTTYLYNYIENNWAKFQENYTHYGKYLKSTNYTWATLPYETWADWNVPWNFGGNDERFPNIVGGNQQGFVLIKAQSDTEDNSNYISNIVADLVTSPNHCMLEGDYILISNIIGDDNQELNGTIQKVITPSEDDFKIDTEFTGTYLGNGVFKRIPKPDIRTKTFAPFWGNGRQCRNKPIRLLIDRSTDGAQITVNLYVSQVDDISSNQGPSDLQPTDNTPYSSIILTGPEPEKELQKLQSLIWHRLNQAVVGDSIQIEFTLSDAQMRDLTIAEAQFNLNAIFLPLVPAGFL